MKQQATIVLILVVLAAMLLLEGCAEPSSKDVGLAEETVAEDTMAEKELLYDNGKNSLVVFTNDWAKAMVILQEWNDRHPDKFISVFSSHSVEKWDGVQTVWLAFYYNIEVCKAVP